VLSPYVASRKPAGEGADNPPPSAPPPPADNKIAPFNPRARHGGD
jgi:hypothetical protein